MCSDDDYSSFFFFNDTATTEIYTLSLHDALPISLYYSVNRYDLVWFTDRISKFENTEEGKKYTLDYWIAVSSRSEEHTSELQSRQYLVCRLLLEKKKIILNFFYLAFCILYHLLIP